MSTGNRIIAGNYEFKGNIPINDSKKASNPRTIKSADSVLCGYLMKNNNSIYGKQLSNANKYNKNERVGTTDPENHQITHGFMPASASWVHTSQKNISPSFNHNTHRVKTSYYNRLLLSISNSANCSLRGGEPKNKLKNDDFRQSRTGPNSTACMSSVDNGPSHLPAGITEKDLVPKIITKTQPKTVSQNTHRKFFKTASKIKI